MKSNPNDLVVYEGQTILDAVRVIEANFVRCAVVVNEEDKVVGVFSEGDVMRALLRGVDMHVQLQQCLPGNFHYLKDEDYPAALRLFRKKGITLLPILDDEFKLHDVITVYDIWERAKIRID